MYLLVTMVYSGDIYILAGIVRMGYDRDLDAYS
jgi:hypothetical protein